MQGYALLTNKLYSSLNFTKRCAKWEQKPNLLIAFSCCYEEI